MQIIRQIKPNELPESMVIEILQDLKNNPRPVQEFHSIILNELLRRKLVDIRRRPSPYMVHEKGTKIQVVVLAHKGHSLLRFEQSKRDLVAKYEKSRDALSNRKR